MSTGLDKIKVSITANITSGEIPPPNNDDYYMGIISASRGRLYSLAEFLEYGETSQPVDSSSVDGGIF